MVNQISRMPFFQHWHRWFVVIFTTLIIFHVLCPANVDSKQVSKHSIKYKVAKIHGAGLQQRRQKIIKCCGKGSCSNVASRLKNDSTTLKTTSKAGKKTLETIVTKLSTQPPEISTAFSTNIIQDDEILEITNLSSSTLSTTTTETSPKPDTTEASTTEISSSISLSTSKVPNTTMSTTATTPIPSTSTSTTPDSTTTSASTSSSTSSSTSTSSTSSTTKTTSKTTTTITSTTTTTSTTTRPLLPGNSLFDLNGVLNDAPRFGSWRDVCGELYLFGKTIVNWNENVRRCCSIGMLPISFQTANQFNCILNIAKTEKWPYNMNYWTSGRRIHSNNTFEWCLTNQTSYFYSTASYMWAAQQPDNSNGSQNCVHMAVPRNKNRTELTDRSCNDTYVFACKGITTPAPKCHVPICPNSTCEKNDASYSVASDQKTKYLTDPKTHGTWINIRHRIYVFSKTSATWQDAATACCAIGTKILSVDNDYEYEMLSEAIAQTKGAVASGQFWTSATDEGCEGAFGWCAVTKIVRGAIWANGKPDIGKRCMTVNVDITNTTLKTYDCSAALRYICETRDTGTATTGGRALKDECASVYNVSDAEQDNIFNSTTYTRKIKCFLKCLGENGGFILNGHLVDETLIKMAEALSPDSIQQLQNDLSAVDTCSQIKGMDECDTAALTFQCGQEKAPALVANAITSVELSSEVEISPLQPLIGSCIADFNCVMDPAKKQAFALSSAVMDGFIETICGKKYFISSTDMDFRSAASKCCEYGLALVSVEAPSELQCLCSGSLGGITRPASFWTSASRKGTVNVFRWCSSKAPLNVSDFSWSGYSVALSQNSIATIYMQPTFAATYFNADPDTGISRFALCEEQPL